MTFDLNLGVRDSHPPVEGGVSAAVVGDRAIGALLLAHLEPDDPFRRWAEHLSTGIFGVDLGGHLTGSIDAVLRLSGDAPRGGASFVVVDYKTNRLHDHGTEPMPGDYGAAAMRRSMVEHHYPLQALLYMVALHRYLRWRVPDYDPEVNLGGCAYLFLRGMSGPGVGTEDGTSASEGGAPRGVCFWRPPPAAIAELSDLLHGRQHLLDVPVADGGTTP